jgi:hypothetical protein
VQHYCDNRAWGSCFCYSSIVLCNRRQEKIVQGGTSVQDVLHLRDVQNSLPETESFALGAYL